MVDRKLVIVIVHQVRQVAVMEHLRHNTELQFNRQWFTSTSTSMYHHQNQNITHLENQFMQHHHKNIIKSSSLRYFLMSKKKQIQCLHLLFFQAPTAPTPTAPVIPLQPQNEEKTLVYVLVKKPEEAPEIHIPTPAPTQPSKPEVYFIRYKTQVNDFFLFQATCAHLFCFFL